MPDAWRAYLEMALGLTEASRKRAQKVAGELVNRGGATAAQLQGLVDDLMSAGMANREALTNIVRLEVDRALGVVGLATAEEVTELTTRVHDLERQLRDAQSRAVAGDDTPEAEIGGTRLDEPAPMPRRAAKKAVAKKAVPNAMPSAGTTPAASPANTAPGTEPLAKKTVAKKAVAKKAPAKAVPPPDEVIPASKRATAKAAPATVEAEKQGRPAKKAVAKKAVAKKAAPSTPAGTTEAPTAPVKEAAAATELPQTQPAKKAAAKRAPVKKAAPPSFVEPQNPEA
jgi:polyhydroxyalkanoate synthesis regulator phasin